MRSAGCALVPTDSESLATNYGASSSRVVVIGLAQHNGWDCGTCSEAGPPARTPLVVLWANNIALSALAGAPPGEDTDTSKHTSGGLCSDGAAVSLQGLGITNDRASQLSDSLRALHGGTAVGAAMYSLAASLSGLVVLPCAYRTAAAAGIAQQNPAASRPLLSKLLPGCFGTSSISSAAVDANRRAVKDGAACAVKPALLLVFPPLAASSPAGGSLPPAAAEASQMRATDRNLPPAAAVSASAVSSAAPAGLHLTSSTLLSESSTPFHLFHSSLSHAATVGQQATPALSSSQVPQHPKPLPQPLMLATTSINAGAAEAASATSTAGPQQQPLALCTASVPPSLVAAVAEAAGGRGDGGFNRDGSSGTGGGGSAVTLLAGLALSCLHQLPVMLTVLSAEDGRVLLQSAASEDYYGRRAERGRRRAAGEEVQQQHQQTVALAGQAAGAATWPGPPPGGAMALAAAGVNGAAYAASPTGMGAIGDISVGATQGALSGDEAASAGGGACDGGGLLGDLFSLDPSKLQSVLEFLVSVAAEGDSDADEAADAERAQPHTGLVWEGIVRVPAVLNTDASSCSSCEDSSAGGGREAESQQHSHGGAAEPAAPAGGGGEREAGGAAAGRELSGVDDDDQDAVALFTALQHQQKGGGDAGELLCAYRGSGSMRAALSSGGGGPASARPARSHGAGGTAAAGENTISSSVPDGRSASSQQLWSTFSAAASKLLGRAKSRLLLRAPQLHAQSAALDTPGRGSRRSISFSGRRSCESRGQQPQQQRHDQQRSRPGGGDGGGDGGDRHARLPYVQQGQHRWQVRTASQQVMRHAADSLGSFDLQQHQQQRTAADAQPRSLLQPLRAASPPTAFVGASALAAAVAASRATSNSAGAAGAAGTGDAHGCGAPAAAHDYSYRSSASRFPAFPSQGLGAATSADPMQLLTPDASVRGGSAYADLSSAISCTSAHGDDGKLSLSPLYQSIRHGWPSRPNRQHAPPDVAVSEVAASQDTASRPQAGSPPPDPAALAVSAPRRIPPRSSRRTRSQHVARSAGVFLEPLATSTWTVAFESLGGHNATAGGTAAHHSRPRSIERDAEALNSHCGASLLEGGVFRQGEFAPNDRPAVAAMRRDSACGPASAAAVAAGASSTSALQSHSHTRPHEGDLSSISPFCRPSAAAYPGLPSPLSPVAMPQQQQPQPQLQQQLLRNHSRRRSSTLLVEVYSRAMQQHHHHHQYPAGGGSSSLIHSSSTGAAVAGLASTAAVLGGATARAGTAFADAAAHVTGAAEVQGTKGAAAAVGSASGTLSPSGARAGSECQALRVLQFAGSLRNLPMGGPFGAAASAAVAGAGAPSPRSARSTTTVCRTSGAISHFSGGPAAEVCSVEAGHEAPAGLPSQQDLQQGQQRAYRVHAAGQQDAWVPPRRSFSSAAALGIGGNNCERRGGGLGGGGGFEDADVHAGAAHDSSILQMASPRAAGAQGSGQHGSHQPLLLPRTALAAGVNTAQAVPAASPASRAAGPLLPPAATGDGPPPDLQPATQGAWQAGQGPANGGSSGLRHQQHTGSGASAVAHNAMWQQQCSSPLSSVHGGATVPTRAGASAAATAVADGAGAGPQSVLAHVDVEDMLLMVPSTDHNALFSRHLRLANGSVSPASRSVHVAQLQQQHSSRHLQAFAKQHPPRQQQPQPQGAGVRSDELLVTQLQRGDVQQQARGMPAQDLAATAVPMATNGTTPVSAEVRALPAVSAGQTAAGQTRQHVLTAHGARHPQAPAAADGPDGADGHRAWHEVRVAHVTDGATGQRLLVVMQKDVTAKVEAERHIMKVSEAEHRLLEQIFPRHVLTYMTQDGCAPLPTAPDALLHRKDTIGFDLPGTSPESDDDEEGLSLANEQSPTTSAWRPHVRDCNALATWHEEVTILFADIQGFTPMCKELPATVVMRFLNDLFVQFDSLVDVYGVYKVETIGDCYVVAGGLIHKDTDGMAAVHEGGQVDARHADRVVQFAKAMLRAAATMRMPPHGGPVRIRVGVHSGPVVSGVVGTRMPRFCLFGDTMNTASRMESTGTPGCIHVSQDTFARLSGSKERWRPSGGIEVKGKGHMETHVWAPAGAR